MKKNSIASIISEYRNNNVAKDQFSTLTNSEIHVLLYGEDSCFLVVRDYHGKYEDDYCNFVYYSNVTGEYFEDYWTTAAACPRCDRYENVKRFSEAEKLGLINIEIFNSQFNPDVEFLKTRKFYYYDENKLGNYPGVKVVRGRKVKKGTSAMFLGIIREPNYMAWKGDNDVALIYTEGHKIEKINPAYLEYDEEFSNELYEFVKGKLDEEMKVTDRIRKFDYKKAIQEYFALPENMEAYQEAIEARKEWERAEEIRKYYPSEKLIEWVKNHFPELNDEEVIEKGIYINKKNNNVNR